ncbi:PREDICTED: uncharacterized protein LOC108662848 [Theobroma cacao]|uniref:Uncharacterized protein LOC108662848 n=1 Tax=Theobroma cacao TaxID=3641 RepID=A0AB32WQ55_THECC|nr:PREDICTED: uncharacterized protein LOC108662848 [Theobroma cacao]
MSALNTTSSPTMRRSRFRLKRKNAMKSVTTRFRRLKTDMEEISKEQESIKEGQRQVRAKFEAIQEECERLREETNNIIQQSAMTQIRLGLMFNILKAREEGNFAKASKLTQLLRSV